MTTVPESIATERRRRHQTMPRRAQLSPRPDRASPCIPSPSPGYVLEWSAGHSAQQYRHILSSMEELRTELLAGESTLLHGRMLVLRTSHIDDVVRETLANMAGVDGEFLDAHVLGRPYRPRAGNRRPRWWTWKYP